MKTTSANWMTLSGLVFVAGCASGGAVSHHKQSVWGLSATPLDRTAAELDILEVEGPRTIKNTLVPYNKMLMHLDAARCECGLFARVHPDARVREVAEEGERAVHEYLAGSMLDDELYEAFRVLDVSGADPTTRYLRHKLLRDYRRGGVDKSSATRTRFNGADR